MRGIAQSGEEDASANGLDARHHLQRCGRQGAGQREPLTQGNDLIAQITVQQHRRTRKLDNLALTQLVPAGWEIRNERLEGVRRAGRNATPDPNAQRQRTGGCRPEWRSRRDAPTAEYVDIRDDRVQQYFSLRAGDSIYVPNAAERGVPRPLLSTRHVGIEAMYDATQHARLKGQWVEVVSAQR